MHGGRGRRPHLQFPNIGEIVAAIRDRGISAGSRPPPYSEKQANVVLLLFDDSRAEGEAAAESG